MLQGQIAEQRVERGQAVVAGGRAVVPVAFEVVQERGDQGHVEVCDVEGARRLAGVLGGVGQQQPEGDLVGPDRVRARGTLADQPVGEVCLQRRRERAHRCAPNRESSRSAARAISSGAADRYQ